jgi:putative membrane protein insertion efficiency factor
VRVALFALRFYKAYLSILFAGNCRFEPTCSRYAYEAIERFGVVRGVWLGTKRLLRCQPLSRRFGFDPVPEKWEIMSSETKAVETSANRAAATQNNEVHS